MSKRSISALAEALTAPPSGRSKKRQAYMSSKKATKYPINGTVGKPRPFPIRMVTTLKYAETISISSAVVSVFNTNIMCNSIYDPNVTGSGHQPYGHDTYSGLYNQYTVLKSFIKVTPASTANSMYVYGLGIEDSTTGSTNFDTWAEKPTYKIQAGHQAGMGGCKSLTCSWDRNKRFPHGDTYRDLSAPFGANPSEIETFNIIMQAGNTSTAIGTNTFFVEVWYTVECYEPRDLGSS